MALPLALLALAVLLLLLLLPGLGMMGLWKRPCLWSTATRFGSSWRK